MLVTDGDAGVKRPVAWQPGQRRNRVGRPAGQALELVRDVGGDVGGQADADQVGEEDVAGPAEIDVGDLPGD